MNYPIDLTFKLMAIANQIYIREPNGNLFGYVKQKLFKLKEDINIFADEAQTLHLYNIKADRIIDFSSRYNFTDAAGRSLGSIKRRGMRSIWKANYEVYDPAGTQIMQIQEESAWVKVVDSLIGELPLIGMFTGYFFNPAYIVSSMDGKAIARMQKHPAFFEGKFQIVPSALLSDSEESIVLLSFLTMALLERSRG